MLGAAADVKDTEANPWMVEDLRVVAELLSRGVPTLGVCLGAQLLAKAAGGWVERAPAPEIGWYEVALEPGAENDPLLAPGPSASKSFQWHSYVAVPPAGSIAAGPQRALPPGLPPGRRPGLGHPVPRRGVGGRRCAVDAALRPRRGRRGHALDPVALQAETDRKIPAWNEPGATSSGASWPRTGRRPAGRPLARA